MMKINNLIKINTILISIICFAAVAEYMNPFVLIFIAGVIIVNFLGIKGYDFYLPRFLANSLGAIVLLAAFLNFSIENMNVIFINALIVLMGLKLMERKQYRDYMQISLMAVFILAGLSLLNLSMVFLIYLLAEVLLIILQMVLLTVMVEDETFVMNKSFFVSILKPITLIMIISIPAAAFLFLILPRTDYPMLSFLNNRQNASTGFTDSIKLGTVNSIQNNDKTAFRVRMEKIDDKFLYWRGVVLDTYRNNGWESNYSGSSTKHNVKRENLNKKIIKYRVFMEPTANKYLYMLNVPVDVTYSDDFTFSNKRGEVVTEEAVKSKISYKGVSYLSQNIKTDLINKKIYLQTSGVSNEVKKIANRLKGENRAGTANNILDYLEPPNFKYSLENLPLSKEPLKHFLTVTKRGNCEYFASAMGVLLRLNGVPARLVGGFRGGYYDKAAGYYSVLYSNAHVWVEAYIDGAWRKYDPTPADFSRFSDKNMLSSLKEIKLFFDKLSYYWTVFVINYDFAKQMEGLKNAGEAAGNIKFDLKLSGKAIFVLSVPFILLLMFVFKKKSAKKSEKILKKFDEVFLKLGVSRTPGEGLMQAVNKIDNKELGGELENLTYEYYSAVYGSEEFNHEKYRMLKKRLNEIYRYVKNSSG